MNTAEFKEYGHDLIDWIAEYLEGIEGRKLFPQTTPADLENLFSESLPKEPVSLGNVLEELKLKLIPNCCHVNHPGYFGFITPSPNPAGILGDLLCSAINQNLGAYSIGPGAVTMERQVITWLCELAGYDHGAGGHLTSGGMMANFEGLKLARDFGSGNRSQHDGVAGNLTVYVSEERHVSIDKAVDVIGLGRNALRTIPTGDDFSVSIGQMEGLIIKDKAAGKQVLCIIGLAGSTNTGAIDDLASLKKIAERENAWFHVDAAYGGGLLLSQVYNTLISDIHLADSITIDPHKWFFAPLDAGALLVKNKSQLWHSYGMKPPYLKDEKDVNAERFDYYAHSFEQSRRFRSLKVWMSFKRYGKKELGNWVERNIGQAQYLYQLCREYPNFYAANDPKMSAVCIRFEPEELDGLQLSKIHIEVARKVEQNGNFWITTTVLKGKSWFRINPVNFRTSTEHMKNLMEELNAECLNYVHTL